MKWFITFKDKKDPEDEIIRYMYIKDFVNKEEIPELLNKYWSNIEIISAELVQ